MPDAYGTHMLLPCCGGPEMVLPVASHLKPLVARHPQSAKMAARRTHADVPPARWPLPLPLPGGVGGNTVRRMAVCIDAAAAATSAGDLPGTRPPPTPPAAAAGEGVPAVRPAAEAGLLLAPNTFSAAGPPPPCLTPPAAAAPVAATGIIPPSAAAAGGGGGCIIITAPTPAAALPVLLAWRGVLPPVPPAAVPALHASLPLLAATHVMSGLLSAAIATSSSAQITGSCLSIRDCWSPSL